MTPYWFEIENLKLPFEERRNKKLSLEDREKIRELYGMGWSIRKIARYFGVHKNTVRFHLFEDYRLKEYARKKQKNYYYLRERHREYMKRYRQHLKEFWGLKKGGRHEKNPPI